MKEFYHSKKKKLRGWKRHKRKIAKWKQDVINLDMDEIQNYQRSYAKLWIHPFYSLVHRNPPNWFNRLLLHAMIDVYFHWYEQMKGEKEDFYLKIWLYEPNFIRSQIVVAYKDCLDFYKHTFDKNPTPKTFPLEKYKSSEEQLSRFQWELHIAADDYWASDLKEDIDLKLRTVVDVEKIIHQSYRMEKIQNDVIYKVNVGDVWVGSLKK